MTLPPISSGAPTPSPEPESEGVGGPAQGLPAPSKGPQLEKEVLALFNPSFDDPQFKGIKAEIIKQIDPESDIYLEENNALLFTDFKEIADKIWLKLTQVNPELLTKNAKFISDNAHKFNQIYEGKNWNSLKAELKERMGGKRLTKETLEGSWDTFRWKFVDKVQELGNLALNSMGISPIEGRALGTLGWKSDIDWEILPPPGMSETHHMLAKLILDVIATHLLGREATETVGRSAGEVLDLEFYTKHYAATEEDFFSQLNTQDTKNEFRMQELTMATLQQIRAGDMGAWRTYKNDTLKELNTSSGLRKVMQGIFDNVEAFEKSLEEEIHLQMFFESETLKSKAKVDLGIVWLKEMVFSSDDFKEGTSKIRNKDSEKYKLAKNTLKAGRLMRLSQMIDEDNRDAQKIKQEMKTIKDKLESLQALSNPEMLTNYETERTKILQDLQKKQNKYEKKILEASFKLAIRTLFSEGAIYTREGYLHTVSEGQKVERKAEAALEERRGSHVSMSSDTSRRSSASSPHSIQYLATRKRRDSDAPLLFAAVAEESAQRRRSVSQSIKVQKKDVLVKTLKQARKKHVLEEALKQAQKAAIESAKYAKREVATGFAAIKEAEIEFSEGEDLRYKTSELEKCKRRTVLSQSGFEGLLKLELERLKAENIDMAEKGLQRLKAENIDMAEKELQCLKVENIDSVVKELERLKEQNIDSVVEDAKGLFEKGKILYDEGTEERFKLAPQEKNANLTEFLAGKGLPVAQSKEGEYLVEDPKIKLILSCKVGLADPNNEEVQKLFDDATQMTLEKLGLNTLEGLSNYFQSLDRNNLYVLNATFKDLDLRKTDLPNLMEIWRAAAL